MCQWFMPAGGPPNPLSGRTTVSMLFHSHCIFMYGGRNTLRKGKVGKMGGSEMGQLCESDYEQLKI